MSAEAVAERKINSVKTYRPIKGVDGRVSPVTTIDQRTNPTGTPVTTVANLVDAKNGGSNGGIIELTDLSNLVRSFTTTETNPRNGQSAGGNGQRTLCADDSACDTQGGRHTCPC